MGNVCGFANYIGIALGFDVNFNGQKANPQRNFELFFNSLILRKVEDIRMVNFLSEFIPLSNLIIGEI